MAQTGFTPILLYSSSTGGNAPAAVDLTNNTTGSELAINITDGKLFYKDNANAVQVIGWKTTPTTAGGTGLTSWTAGDLPYYASGTTLSKLGIGSSGQILTSTGTAPQWSTLSGVAVTTFSTGTTGLTPSSATSGAITLAGTLITSNGGTGLSSFTQGDLLYYNSGTTLTALAKNTTATRYLSNTGTNNNPAWAQIDLSNGVTGTLPAGNGGTGVTSLGTGVATWLQTPSSANLAAAVTGETGSGALVFGTNPTFSNTGGAAAANFTNSAFQDVLVNFFNAASTVGNKITLQFASNGGSTTTNAITSYGSAYGGTPSLNNAISITNASGSLWLTSSGGVSIGSSTDPGATNLRVQGTGRFGTTVGVGAATPATSGAGITFPATHSVSSDANTLDDYEEGIWTPTFIATGTGLTSVTYDFQTGTYTKIGNVVYCSVNIRSSAITIGAATGDAAIGGLPFTAIDYATPYQGRYANWATTPSGFRPFNNRMSCNAANSTAALSPTAAFATGGFSNFLNYTFFFYTND